MQKVYTIKNIVFLMCSVCSSFCYTVLHNALLIVLRPVTDSSLIVLTPKWRGRRSMMSWTDCTWPCPTKEMTRCTHQNSFRTATLQAELCLNSIPNLYHTWYGRALSSTDNNAEGKESLNIWSSLVTAVLLGKASVHPWGSINAKESHGGGPTQIQTGM